MARPGTRQRVAGLVRCMRSWVAVLPWKGDHVGARTRTWSTGSGVASRRLAAAGLTLTLLAVLLPGGVARAATVSVVVTGTVQDTSGQPVAFVSIQATSDATITPLSVSTNKGGAYRLVVPVGSTLTVRADVPTYIGKQQVRTFSGDAPGAVTIDFTGANALIALPALLVDLPPAGLSQGDTLTVSGRAYTPGAAVTVRLAGSDLSQKATADSSGAFQVTFALPYSLAPGLYTLTSEPGSASSPGVIVRAGAAPPTSPPATATSTPAPSPTSVPTITPTATDSPTPTASATATPSPSPSPSPTAAAVVPHPAARAHFLRYTRRWAAMRLTRLERAYSRTHACPSRSRRHLCHLSR